MTQYELTFLLEKEDDVNKIKELIHSFSGEITQENNWGKKDLCYSIKKHSQALFYNWLIELNANQLSELKKKLNFNEQIIRYLLLKID